jgi:hypothetical protein
VNVLAAATAVLSLAIPWRPATYGVQGTVPVQTAIVAGAYVARIDTQNTYLAMYPGTSEPPSVRLRGIGAVPWGQRWRLLATFNGGFKASAWAGGFLVNGHADIPLRPGLGTLVEYANGQIDILEWHGPPSPRKLVLARQNLPLLVSNGRVGPTVAYGSSWGATLGGVPAVWRTAIGVNRNGDLLYVAAPGQTAPSLAALMVRVGAVRAIQLDINPQWPSFISYAKRGGRNPLKLVPNPMQSASRWLWPDSRDFFAVYTRKGGAPVVPFR